MTPPPARMYTIGCNFDTKREASSCRDYEYGVEGICLLNYCSSEVPCYAGRCDINRHVCTNITSARQLLPASNNPLITLGDDPFGTHKEGINPVLIIMMAAGSVIALAILGCIFRTATHWTKTSVAWASSIQKSDSNSDEKNLEANHGGEQNGDSEQKEQEPASDVAKMPSKFSGPHHMPPSPGHHSNDVSPFTSPLPSPHFSPYSQPNGSQVSNNSLLNPFRQGANDSSISIELRNTAMNASHESLNSHGSSQRSSVLEVRSAPIAYVPTSSPLGRDSLIGRSQTVSGTFPHGNRTSHLHKSMSMQSLGSRPAPPPPTMHSGSLSPPMHSGSLSPPMIAVTYAAHPRMSQADMQGPSPSLDSLIDHSPQSNDSGASSPEISPISHPSSNTIAAFPSASSFVLQSGAERHPSLTVPAKQSMLRHSASVPQMVVSHATPANRNLPAGFESSPVSVSSPVSWNRI
ncbi:hypothetical protein BG011_007005 [Mortierella polycephala]|uniref:Uncharacterized protein n=1 Tax=Mortierella polycephala TaxID=41804 RepID=A0A9P6PTA2_9FUNG|nr:hypothetical protein BG011_007005 [Mortierella polycephala]